MNYVVAKHPNVLVDMMVEERFYPQLIGYFQRTGCHYKKEREADPKNGKKYRVLKDVTGPGGNLGELIGLFYSLEWGNLIEGEPHGKFYIMINPRRKGKKKNVREDRKEADSGSEGGDRGESTGDAGPEQMGGSDRDWLNLGDVSFDDPGEFPGQPTTCDGRCE